MPFYVFVFLVFTNPSPFAVFIFDDSELRAGSEIQSILPTIASLHPHGEGERRLAASYYV
jgi:hypothetical protein